MKKRYGTLAAMTMAMTLMMGMDAQASGWRWADYDKDLQVECYYTTNEYDALLKNATTPDGYQVDDQGRWVVDGVVQKQDPNLNDPEKFVRQYYFTVGEPSESDSETVKLERAINEELRKFVYSFDWQHASDWEKLNAIQNRLFVGYNGNVYEQYGNKNNIIINKELGVLVLKKGGCEDYAFTFDVLAHSVGLKSAACYTENYTHQYNLVVIDGVTIIADPSVIGKGIIDYTPVDWDTELHRAERKMAAETAADPDDEINRRYAAGTISEDECYTYFYGITLSQILNGEKFLENTKSKELYAKFQAGNYTVEQMNADIDAWLAEYRATH